MPYTTLPSASLRQPRRNLPGVFERAARLIQCEHDWSLPYVSAYSTDGRPRVAEWRCKHCHRRRTSRVI